MARFGYTFSGGAPVLKRYKLRASASTKGILVQGLNATTGQTQGIDPVSTTAGAEIVGLTTDTGVYTTTQSSTMTEGLVTVIVNPDLVSKWLMSGTTAGGGALLTTTNSSSNAAGTTVTITTGDPAPNSPTMVDGTMVCISGANALQANNPMALAVITVGSTTNAVDTGSRGVTSVSGTTAVATVPYPNTIAVGDVFLVVPFAHAVAKLANRYPILTTNLDQVRANAALAAAASGIPLRAVEILWDSPSGTGTGSPIRINSFVLMNCDDHVFNHNAAATGTY